MDYSKTKSRRASQKITERFVGKNPARSRRTDEETNRKFQSVPDKTH